MGIGVRREHDAALAVKWWCMGIGVRREHDAALAVSFMAVVVVAVVYGHWGQVGTRRCHGS